MIATFGVLSPGAATDFMQNKSFNERIRTICSPSPARPAHIFIAVEIQIESLKSDPWRTPTGRRLQNMSRRHTIPSSAMACQLMLLN